MNIELLGDIIYCVFGTMSIIFLIVLFVKTLLRLNSHDKDKKD